MLTIAADGPDRVAADGPARLSISVATLDEAEALWRAFESDAVATPYQRFDWVRAYALSHPDETIRVVVVRDAVGRTDAIWPLATTARWGVRMAGGVGGKHANVNMPLFRPDHGLGGDPGATLRRIAEALAIDLLSVPAMPARWAGAANPFAPFGRPAPDVAPEVRLDADPDATANRSMSNEARKRLRNKERGLAKIGEVRFGRAATVEQADALLAAFFRQKERRFRDLGIPDPFLEPSVRAFIREGCTAGLDRGRPAVELYSLQVGGTVAAVLGGAADARRLSGMFVSFEADPEAMKYSPGDILVSRIIREQCRLGRHVFDLGRGEARYKRTFCDEELALVELLVPVTARGRLLCGADALWVSVRRRLKRSPYAMRALSIVRRAKSALRS